MPLRLTITSYHKLTPGQCSEKVLDQGQLTIGRGPDNDWVLPDPERLVSSRHCTILNRDGVYYLTDTSTNGVLLVNAGHRLRRGNSEPLQDGETVRLGEYDILVQLGHDIALPGSGNPQTDPFTSFDALMKAPGEHLAAQRLAVDGGGVGLYHRQRRGIQFADHLELVLRPRPLAHHGQQLEQEDPQGSVRRLAAHLFLQGFQGIVQAPGAQQFFGDHRDTSL